MSWTICSATQQREGGRVAVFCLAQEDILVGRPGARGMAPRMNGERVKVIF